MAKKTIGLTNYLTKILAIAFTGTVLILASALVLFFFLLQTKVISPANAGEIAANNEIAKQEKADHFSEDFAPDYFDYIYFDKAGEVVSSSLQGNDLKKIVINYSDTDAKYVNGKYITFSDGSRSLYVWQYKSQFTNPWLRKHFPSIELLAVAIVVLTLLLFFLILIRTISRNLNNKIELVNQASQQVRHQDLATPIETSAGLKEFNHALESIEDLRVALKDSLSEQWQKQQQQQQELAALSHDLKTPLTIINGNTELILEDELTEEQRSLVKAIYQSSNKAKAYVNALQEVSNFELRSETKISLNLKALFSEINQTLAPLANQKNLKLTYHFDEKFEFLGDKFNLERALIIIGENAINHTSKGEIKVSARQLDDFIQFVFEDNGPGFSGEALEHGKEMFWRQDKSRNNSGNYGLGLALADKIAKQNEGSLMLANSKRGGKVSLEIKIRSLNK